MKLRKTPQAERNKFVYSFDDDSKTIIEIGKSTTIRANGEVTVETDDSITEVTIKSLHQADDREVDNNLKHIHCESDAEMAERRKFKKEWAVSHPGEENPYEPPSRAVSLDGLVGENGEGIGDKSRIENEAVMLASSDNDGFDEEREQVRNLVKTFTPKMQQLYFLRYVMEYPQSDIASILHVDKCTVSLRLKKLEEKIKKYFEENKTFR